MDESSELRLLFHRLNNELAIILANAELLEAKAREEIARARAAQVVASVLDAMGTSMKIQDTTGMNHDCAGRWVCGSRGQSPDVG
jgi:hypothetical protein